MSESGNSGTSILLPGARVSVFTKDGETIETVRALVGDWRFARVVLKAHEGDVNDAISLYEKEASPDLVIVQTEEIDDAFAQRLEALGGCCAEGTGAIVIGPVNDVYLYRRLIGMGVNDYLVRPVKPLILGEVIAKSLIEKMGASGCRLIAVAGAKGGVGTSLLAQILASGIADQLHQKTLLLDAAGSWSTTGVGLGFEATTTLTEALKGGVSGDEQRLNRMLFASGDRLSVLASGGDVMLEHAVAPDQIEKLLNVFMVKFPVIVFDLSSAPVPVRRSILARAHKVLLASMPTLPSLRLARTLLLEIKELRGGSAEGVDLVLNMQGFAPTAEATKSDIESALDCKPAATLPFNPKLFAGLESQGKKFTEDKAGADVARVLVALVQKIIGAESEDSPSSEKHKQGGGMGGLLNILKSK